jgi:UDP-GlcNAc:undecaprenyl-phosphate/decaprenyl-phosphate GlcNAc-1-phosphate transferase
MPPQLYYFLAFLISALIVLGITPVVKNLAMKSGRVDIPNERKVHERPMVRLGGVAIFIGTLIGLLIVWFADGFNNFNNLQPQVITNGLHQLRPEVLGVTLGGLGFFLIGLADDLFNLSPVTRLILQIAIASWTWFSGVRIEFLSVPFAEPYILSSLSLPITVIWLVGMANAVNWIDGLDGLAAGVSGIAAVLMLVVCLFKGQVAAALIAAALAGACLGFLRYNFNPAQIFMGDGGAYFMGFTLAGVGVIGLVKGTAFTSVALLYLILAVPITDMSAVILSRLRKGKSPFIADKTHLHHRLLEAGISHRFTVLFIYALTLWVGSLALAFAGLPSGIAYALAATFLLAYLSWQVWQKAKSS